jgi:hypothetical protein
MDWDSVVSIATRYILDSLGIEFRWEEEMFSSPHPCRPTLGSNGLHTLNNVLFSTGQRSRSMALYSHPRLVPTLKMGATMVVIPSVFMTGYA